MLVLLAFTTIGNAQLNNSELLERFELNKNSPGSIYEFFTIEELDILRQEIAGDYVSQGQDSNRGANASAIAWESVNLGYGNFDISMPNPYTTVSAGSGTPAFEAAGAVDPSNNTVAYVADNVGEMWSLDIASGVYTSIGNMGIFDATGLEFDTTSGTLYMTTLTELYTVDVTTPSATLVGALGTTGVVAIALAIDGNGDGYTYDIVDDTFYSVDLSTGAATAIGFIGFDAAFGQGMFYDHTTNQVMMTSLNAASGNLGELRTVDLTTGTTTLIGEWNPGEISQLAWASPLGLELLSTQNYILADSISVFPNPTNGDLNINFARNLGAADINIINLNGQIVLNTSLEANGNNTIETSKLVSGIYFAEITSDNGNATIKFIKN